MASRYNVLQQQRDSLLKESRDLFAKADAEGLSKEDVARDDEITAELRAVNEEIARWERQREREKAEVAALPETTTPSADESRRDPRQFSGLGEFLQAVACAGNSLMAHRLPNADKLIAKLGAYQAASGMSVGVPSDGGFLVRKDWTAELLNKAREASVLFQRCRNIPIGADFDGLEYPYIDETSRADGSRWGGVQVYWKAEAAAVTAKAPKIGKGELRLEEIMGLAYATERLIRDASALQGILSDGFESEFAFKIDDSIVRGNGAGKPLGFFTSPVIVSVAKETSQTAATVVVGNVLKMYARMPPRLKPGAVWLIHSDVMTQLPQMAIGQMPVWIPPGGLTNQPNGILLGKPVIEIEQAEALGTQGDIFLVNLNEYAVITKANEGVRYDTSMHVKFLTDEMAFRWVFRINGQPVWRAPLTPFKGSSTLSPFVTLDTRS